MSWLSKLDLKNVHTVSTIQQTRIHQEETSHHPRWSGVPYYNPNLEPDLSGNMNLAQVLFEPKSSTLQHCVFRVPVPMCIWMLLEKHTKKKRKGLVVLWTPEDSVNASQQNKTHFNKAGGLPPKKCTQYTLQIRLGMTKACI